MAPSFADVVASIMCTVDRIVCRTENLTTDNKTQKTPGTTQSFRFTINAEIIRFGRCAAFTKCRELSNGVNFDEHLVSSSLLEGFGDQFWLEFRSGSCTVRVGYGGKGADMLQHRRIQNATHHS